MKAEIEGRIADLIGSGRSVLVVIKDNRSARLPAVAAAIDGIGVGLGYYLIRVPTANIEKHFEAIDAADRSVVMLLRLV